MPLIERLFLDVVGAGERFKLGVADDFDLLRRAYCRLPNCLSESARVARALLRGDQFPALLPGNEQGEQHGQQAFPSPLHAGPDKGDGIRDKAEEGLFPVLKPALFRLEPLDQLFPFPRLFPVAEALDGEGQGMAVALVFINLVDLELVP